MKRSRIEWPLVALALAVLAALGWAYRGDVGRLVAGSVSAEQAYIGPYPAQYLPAILLVPEPPPPPPPPPPVATLHVGLSMRWDGSGYIFFDGYAWRPGTHVTRVVDQQLDADSVRVQGEQWYSPNPLSFDSDSWYCDYNTVSNRAEFCSGTADPAWKWSYWWLLPADVVPANGGRVTIDGRGFDVSGPHTIDTGFGPANYWRLRNRDRFLFYSNGGEWTQYVEAGDVNLYYEVGSGLLLYSNIKRAYYKNGESTSNYVQYEELISQRAGRDATAGTWSDAPDEATAEASGAAAMLARLSAAGIDPATLAAR